MANHFGQIFGEEISRGRQKRNFSHSWLMQSAQNPKDRFFLFVFLLVFGLGLLLARLFTLTVIEGGRYRKAAQENRIREIKIPAPRGIIYDRSNNALLRNIPIFKSIKGKFYFEQSQTTLSADLSETTAREYIFGPLFAHVLGYTGEIGEKELENPFASVQDKESLKLEDAKNEYQMGDIVGKMGLEREYDGILRGIDGKTLYEVDATENFIRTLGKVDPVPGKNITLSLDLSLQKKAEEVLNGKKGAVIVSVPKTGEILTLYSSPSFEPNNFIRDESVEKILLDENKPLFNRAIAGLYPPGSTFKIITAIAGLETGVIKRETEIEDTGVLTVGKYSYANWYFTQYGKKEGLLDVVSAFKRSNDIFFYKTGESLGVERLADWAKKFDLGKFSGLDLPGEEKGLFPDPEWLEKTKGESWYLGNTYHVAIGQGDILATPLQVNLWTNTIANNGKLCQPHLLKDTLEANKMAVSSKKAPDKCRDLGIKPENISLVRQGMKLACSEGGTGWPLFNFKVKNGKLTPDGVNFFEIREASSAAKNWVGIPTACKTGTAEYGDIKGRTHAWFTVFAPVNDPKISVTVLIEGGGEGSSVAAPMAKKILEDWFSR